MDVLSAPSTATTTRTSTRSRPRRWPSNENVAARRRGAGHDHARTGTVPTSTIEAVDPTGAAAPRVLVADRQRVTPLDRARLALVGSLLVAAVATAALPGRGDPGATAARRRSAPPVAAVATTTPCSPIVVDCCAEAVGPRLDPVRGIGRPCA